MDSINTSLVYATVGRRLKASIVDGIVSLALIVAIPVAVQNLTNTPISGMGFLMYAPVFILEPFLISFWGRTIGHYVFGLRVIRENDLSKCPLPQSFGRFFVKALLGWWSMFYLVFSKKQKALHDYLAGTLVILSPERLAKNPSLAGNGELESEEDEKFTYPSALRRFVFFVIWYIVSLFGMFFLLFFFLSAFMGNERADQLVEANSKSTEIFGVLLLIAMAALAAKGRLPGAKRKKKLPEGD